MPEEANLSLGPFRFTPTGVVVSGRPDIEQWTGPLQFAIWCQRASPWWIGDMLNAGDRHFGELFSQACVGEVSADMLQRYESVARRVPKRNRRASLSWSAHAAVARLPHDAQRTLLIEAEQRGWNSDMLRKKARQWERGSTL